MRQMWSTRPLQRYSLVLFRLATANVALFALASFCQAQTAPVSKQSTFGSSQEVSDAAQLLAAIGKLNEKFLQKMKQPSPRTESNLLPLLPSSTVGFVTIANYGDLAHQAVQFLD